MNGVLDEFGEIVPALVFVLTLIGTFSIVLFKVTA